MKTLNIKEVELLAHVLAKELLSFDEPIPDFAARYPNVLESCLAVPFQKFGKKFLYEGLLGKAAILFYLMIKNHPFENGNKRIAMTTLFVFLYKNDKWLKVDEQELYNFAVWVAESPAGLKNKMVEAIEEFLGKHVVDDK